MPKHVKVLKVVVTNEVLLYGDEVCYHHLRDIQPVRDLSLHQPRGPEEYVTGVEVVRCPVYAITTRTGTSYLALEPELLALMEDHLKLNDKARQADIQRLMQTSNRLSGALALRGEEADKWKRRALHAERELDSHTNTGFWKRIWMTLTKDVI